MTAKRAGSGFAERHALARHSRPPVSSGRDAHCGQMAVLGIAHCPADMRRSAGQPQLSEGQVAALLLDVGRTFGLMVLAAIALVGCIVLYAMDKTTGATAMLAVAEAILFTGFGVQIERHAGQRVYAIPYSNAND
jgi:hypothetical protein